MNISEQKLVAAKIRARIIDISNKKKISHLGSSLSCVDILVALYWGVLNLDKENSNWDERDRCILSKGHAASALYAVLAEYGYIDDAMLETQGDKGSALEEHPGLHCVPGVEAAAGSLGHGLSLCCGIALAAKIKKQDYRTFVVLSDGECNEGSVWEAAMFASANTLDNVCAIIDFNKWQATGRSCEVMALQSLKEKWKSFGWQTCEIDGHDFDQLNNALTMIKESTKPLAIIANTVKGKGVSFMEDDNNWHYRIPSVEEVEKSRIELGVL